MPESDSLDLAGDIGAPSDRQEQAADPGDHRGSIRDLSSQVQELRLEIEQLRAASPTTAVLPPVEFPKFNGDDYRAWVYRCQQLFEVYGNIPDDVRVKLASIHMGGDSLRWHKKFMSNRGNLPIPWKEYVEEIGNKFGDQRIEISSEGKRSTPSAGMKRHGPWICKLRDDDEDDGGRVQELNDEHFRFGPVYCTGEREEHSSVKRKAWEVVLKKSPRREAETTEGYTSEIRLLEKEARACYADGLANSLTGPQFRWMMIRDGCFFLQLTMHVLGESNELGYPYDDPIFGRGKSTARFKDVKEWIEAMFHVGNQIPFVVLKRLVKQDYFQTVIKKGKWEKPSDVSRMTLYELLLFPELEVQSLTVVRGVKGLWRKIFDSRSHWLERLEPCDLLHGFQLLVVGPGNEANVEEEEEEEEDGNVEADREPISYVGTIDDMESRSAAELMQTGIHFWDSSGIGSRGMNFMNSIFCCHCPSSGIGSRGIHFMNSIFCCHGYAILHLPPILLRDDTEMMFLCLKNYEMSQKASTGEREVCSYIRYMGELIRTPDDAKIMEAKGIIQGNVKLKHKLPRLLRRMASKNTYNQNIRRVKLKVGDYSPPIWKKYWQVLTLGFAVAVLQTVYTVLPYYTKN